MNSKTKALKKEEAKVEPKAPAKEGQTTLAQATEKTTPEKVEVKKEEPKPVPPPPGSARRTPDRYPAKCAPPGLQPPRD